MRAFLVALCLFAVGSTAKALDPSSLKLTVYGVWLFTTSDCSGTAVEVFNGTTGQEVDVIAGGSYGSGNVSPNTFRCIVLKMSDNVKFTPSTSDGSCTAGTEYTMDVCQTGTSSAGPDGTTVNCTTGTNDRPYVFLANGSTCTGSGCSGDTFVSPTSGAANGLFLDGQIVAPGGGTFGADANGRISGSGSSCEMPSAPTFYWR